MYVIYFLNNQVLNNLDVPVINPIYLIEIFYFSVQLMGSSKVLNISIPKCSTPFYFINFFT
jgi:hypothetical protein